MERGFDKLNNVEGLTMIVVAALLIMGIIVVGGVYTTAIERENRKKRQANRADANNETGNESGTEQGPEA